MPSGVRQHLILIVGLALLVLRRLGQGPVGKRDRKFILSRTLLFRALVQDPVLLAQQEQQDQQDQRDQRVLLAQRELLVPHRDQRVAAVVAVQEETEGTLVPLVAMTVLRARQVIQVVLVELVDLEELAELAEQVEQAEQVATVAQAVLVVQTEHPLLLTQIQG